jgi:hypothetical protein
MTKDKMFQRFSEIYEPYKEQKQFSISALSDFPLFYVINPLGKNETNDFERAQSIISNYHEFFNELVTNGFGLLFQNFKVKTITEFDLLSKNFHRPFLPYTGAKVRISSDKIFDHYRPTSTPPFRKNFLHNEMAYQRDIPTRIMFFCEKMAPLGGESLLGDQRKVFESIPLEYREKLLSKKLKFVRCLINRSKLHDFLSKRLDLFATFPSWQNNLQTEDKMEAAKICEVAGFEVAWTSKNDLVISVLVDPVMPHPVTKELMWVNNAHLFQVHSKVYGKAIYYMAKIYQSLSKKPMTLCYYGDGTPIEKEVVSAILEATEKNEFAYLLKNGEFIYCHNQCISHGRKTFQGPRSLYFSLPG